MVGAVQGLPATLNPGVQLETLSETRALLDALTLVRHPSGLHAASFVGAFPHIPCRIPLLDIVWTAWWDFL